MKSLFQKTKEILTKKKKINKKENKIDYNKLDKEHYFCCPKCKEKL